MTELNLSSVDFIARQDIPRELSAWRAGIVHVTGGLALNFTSPDKSSMISIYGDGVIRTSFSDDREPVYVETLHEALEVADTGAMPAPVTP